MSLAVPRFLTRQPNFVGSAWPTCRVTGSDRPFCRRFLARLVGRSPPMAPLPCSAQPRALTHPRRVELRLSRLITTISCAVPIPLLCYVLVPLFCAQLVLACVLALESAIGYTAEAPFRFPVQPPPTPPFSRLGLIDACARWWTGWDGRSTISMYQLAIRYWWFIFDLFIYFISRANPLSAP